MAKSKKNKLPIKLDYPILKEIDFSNQKVISYSQYSTYKSCAYKWYNQSVLKIKQGPNINMTFGTAIHNTLQHYLTTMYTQSGAAADRIDIVKYFEEQLKISYLDEMTKYGKHYSDQTELNEYYEDGVAILKWFKSHRNAYFTSKNDYLIGCELPLQKEITPNVVFQGYIDLAIYNSNVNKITLFDFKTSTKGWNDWNKKDENKISQLILYKQLFSELYNFPIENIDVEFMILKRKVQPNEFVEFPKRIQEFKPAAGSIKLKQVQKSFESFINDIFDDNGQYVIKEYPKTITKLCDWCYLYKEGVCKK